MLAVASGELKEFDRLYQVVASHLLFLEGVSDKPAAPRFRGRGLLRSAPSFVSVDLIENWNFKQTYGAIRRFVLSLPTERNNENR